MPGRVNSYQRVESTGELTSSVKTPSLLALAMARSRRVNSWTKLSPLRRLSMAKELCPS